MRRLLVPFALALITVPALPRDDEEESVSVAAAGDVVVHNVDRGELVGRFREVDRLLEAGEDAKAGAELADILLGELPLLVEEREGVYLRAADAALLRTAALPAEGLAAYRKVVDPHAAGALVEGLASRSARALARASERMVLATSGPRILVSYADRLIALGEPERAAGVLEDLLRHWRPSAEAGVALADVLSRLGGVLSALGDTAGIHGILDRALGTVLDGPSPAFDGTTLRAELERAAQASPTSFAKGARRTLPLAPRTKLRIAGEMRMTERGALPQPVLPGREIVEHPVSLDLPDGPVLVTRALVRIRRRGYDHRRAYLLGLAPAKESAAGAVPPLEVRWHWPLDNDRTRVEQGAPQFSPVVVGDLLLMPWPKPGASRAHPDAVHSLLLMDVGGSRPRVLDERGVDEAARRDPDAGLARLTFCGRPAVAGDAVYASLVGRSEESGATEFHLARFDLVRHGLGMRLRFRWRTHVLDGSAVAEAAYGPNLRADSERPLVRPTSPLVRHGRVYAGSNSGAVACLDGRTGDVLWLETYPRRPASPRMTVRPASPTSWHEVPLRADGRLVMVAPRDADGFGRYAAMPETGRSTLVDWTRVRDLGTAGEPGSIFHYLITEQIVGVRDGWVYCAGQVPPEAAGALTATETPLVAYRQRPARPGEPGRHLLRAQVPDSFTSGHAAFARDAILLGTGKAIYRVELGDFEADPQVLFRAPDEHPAEDRIGNLVPAGPGRLWSVTPDRVVLFAAE